MRGGPIQCCVRVDRHHNPVFWAGWCDCHHTHGHLGDDKLSSWCAGFQPSHKNVQHRCRGCYENCPTSTSSNRCVRQKKPATPPWIQESHRPVKSKITPPFESDTSSGDSEPPENDTAPTPVSLFPLSWTAPAGAQPSGFSEPATNIYLGPTTYGSNRQKQGANKVQFGASAF